MRCEYNNCNKKAYKNFLNLIFLCKKHYLIVLDNLNNPIKIGRPRKIKIETIFKWLEKFNYFEKEYITLNEFMKEFSITYPTALFYFNILEKYKFIKKQENKYIIKSYEL